LFKIGHNQTVITLVIVSLGSASNRERLHDCGRRGYRPKRNNLLGRSGGPGGTRTRVFLSAIEEQVGEKGENVVHYVYYYPKSPYNWLHSLHAVSEYLFPNCSRSMKQGKVIRKPVQMGIRFKWCPWKTSPSLFAFIPLIKKPVLDVSLIH